LELIFGLPAIFGLLPLIIYILLAFRKGMNLVVLVFICVLAGAILTVQTPKMFGTQFYASVGSFLGLVGVMIMSGSGLGNVLRSTGVADNIVNFLVRRVGVNTQSRAIISVMICTVTMTTLLGTLAGANAVIAPIIISLVATVGLTPWTVAVLFQGAGQAGLFLSPVSAATVTLMEITGKSYPYLLGFVGLPIALVMNVGTFFIAKSIQKQSEGKVGYENVPAPEGEYKASAKVKKSTVAFSISMFLLVLYGILVSGGAAFAVIIMLTVSVVTGLFAGMEIGAICESFCEGAGKMVHMFFALVGFDMLMFYVNGSGGFQTLVTLLEPFAMSGGKVGFAIVSTIIGIFGVGGTAVAQVAVIDGMFKPLVEALQLNIGCWAMVLLVGSQITSFAYPGNDMMGAMALARCTSIKPMIQLAYKWIIPSTFLLTIIWTALFG
jgi:H+/gluconate symporter-like permease